MWNQLCGYVRELLLAECRIRQLLSCGQLRHESHPIRFHLSGPLHLLQVQSKERVSRRGTWLHRRRSNNGDLRSVASLYRSRCRTDSLHCVHVDHNQPRGLALPDLGHPSSVGEVELVRQLGDWILDHNSAS